MVDPEVALPDIIDIKLTPYASKALSTGRKKFEPLYFKFTHSNGLPALKGMIETKLNTAIPTMLQNMNKFNILPQTLRRMLSECQ